MHDDKLDIDEFRATYEDAFKEHVGSIIINKNKVAIGDCRIPWRSFMMFVGTEVEYERGVVNLFFVLLLGDSKLKYPIFQMNSSYRKKHSERDGKTITEEAISVSRKIFKHVFLDIDGKEFL